MLSPLQFQIVKPVSYQNQTRNICVSQIKNIKLQGKINLRPAFLSKHILEVNKCCGKPRQTSPVCVWVWPGSFCQGILGGTSRLNSHSKNDQSQSQNRSRILPRASSAGFGTSPRIIFPKIPTGPLSQHLTSLKERNFKLDKK